MHAGKQASRQAGKLQAEHDWLVGARTGNRLQRGESTQQQHARQQSSFGSDVIAQAS